MQVGPYVCYPTEITFSQLDNSVVPSGPFITCHLCNKMALLITILSSYTGLGLCDTTPWFLTPYELTTKTFLELQTLFSTYVKFYVRLPTHHLDHQFFIWSPEGIYSSVARC